MEREDDDGVGFVADSHYLRSGGTIKDQAMTLLRLPERGDREPSISSSVSDLDVPIYSSEALTTKRIKVPEGQKECMEELATSEGSTSGTYKDNNLGLTGKLFFAILASAIGSAFQHGYNTGVLNNPQSVIEEWMRQTITDKTSEVPSKERVTLLWSVIVSIYCVGGMIGGLITGYIADKMGRKYGLIFNNILILISSACMGSSKVAKSYELIIFARFLLGINSGLNAGLTPMYLSEISPVSLRGAISSVYQLVITISILIAQVFGYSKIFGTPTLWPLLLGLILVPAIFQMSTLPFCPESPKYLLISKGKPAEAEKSLIWFRGTTDVKDEMDQMKSESEAMKLIPKITVKELFVNSALRVPLIISLVVMVAQQFSGINAVIYYSTDIFKSAKLGEEGATTATMVVGLINVLMTIVSIFLVEKAGRKILLVFGFAGMFFCTICLTISIKYSATSTVAGYFCIVFVLLYIVMFASGPGSIPWFLVSELFNQGARPTATSLAVFINWFANFLVGLTFLPIKQAIDENVFIIFIVLQALFLLFIYKKVPETKNKTVEEISALFRQQSYE